MPTKQHTMPTTPKTEETKTNPINYTVERLKDGTARLLVEQTPVPGPLTRPVAVRYLIDDHGEPVIRRAALLGYDRINPSLLFLIVRAGDLISLGKRTIGETSTVWTHYKVGRGFRLMEIAIKGRCLTYSEIRSRVGPYRPLEQPSGCDDLLRDFFAYSGHPKWMLPILERQKKKWRLFYPTKFYRLAPFEVPDAEIPQVVKTAPGAALQLFLPKLTKRQIRNCIRRSLTTAIVHAFTHLPPTQFKKALRKHPSILLTYQGTRLKEELLLRCARFEPMVAFCLRKRFPPPLHARLLAQTCGLPFHLFKCGNITQLSKEIETSFLRHPVEWVETYHNDFSKLFRTLVRHGGMKVDQDLIKLLEDTLPPPYLAKLHWFIADSV